MTVYCAFQVSFKFLKKWSSEFFMRFVKFPGLIMDHSGMLPGSPGHNKTLVVILWRLSEPWNMSKYFRQIFFNNFSSCLLHIFLMKKKWNSGTTQDDFRKLLRGSGHQKPWIWMNGSLSETWEPQTKIGWTFRDHFSDFFMKSEVFQIHIESFADDPWRFRKSKYH